jgi:ribonuclease BN (tRNA processing enzyme)
MINLKFSGVGSAFSPASLWQTQGLLTSANGKVLLLDCGSDARHSLRGMVQTRDIDAVYISHMHGDHVHGLEFLGFTTYFTPNMKKPTLFVVNGMDVPLWNHVLRGTMESVQGRMVTLHDYFDVHSIKPNKSFVWEEYTLTPIQTIHIMNGYVQVQSYGLMITDGNRKIFLTSDTQFAPGTMSTFYNDADLIVHDCETMFRKDDDTGVRHPIKSGVHAHIADLDTLPESVKNKMMLVHYQFIDLTYSFVEEQFVKIGEQIS